MNGSEGMQTVSAGGLASIRQCDIIKVLSSHREKKAPVTPAGVLFYASVNSRLYL